MGLQVRLAGGVALDVDGVAVDTAGLGRLGRVALAYLVTERHRPVTRDDLAEVLWGENLPPTWETSVRVVVSRLRALLARAGLPPGEALTTDQGCYRLDLGTGASVDVEVAEEAVARAEAALGQARVEDAVAAARVAVDVVARQFLAGAPGVWVERRQAEVRELHLRALDTLAAAASASGDSAAAVRAAEEAVTMEPFREPAWVRLMAAHDAAGSRGEALRTYERCRRLLADELGVGPSPATEAAHSGLLAEEVPAAARAQAHLPVPLNTFVGRARELAEIGRLLSSGPGVPRSRLLTLTGTGGVGKSRLALEAARRWGGARAAPQSGDRGASGFADHVVLVELASLAEPLLVDAYVLSALGLGEEDHRSPADTIVAKLGGDRLLMILDNCEHLLAACAALAERLLSRCAEVRILATSREPLRVPGETTLSIGPLPSPDPRHLPSAEAALTFDAVRLLVDRAMAVAPDFELTPANAEAAAQICQGLDGIPLALELAAAQTRALSLSDIAKRLDDRFSLLTRGARTAPPRHRTLRAAVDSTYEALGVTERATFDRLSVFAGAFTLEAAEQVGGAPGGASVLDVITRLVETSLIDANTRSVPTRYSFPETIRSYGRERLASSHDATTVRARHLDWATARAEQASTTLEGAGQSTALDSLDADQDDLRAAIAWGSSPASPAGAGLRAATALGRYWEVRGQLSEGRLLLDAALSDGARAAHQSGGGGARAAHQSGGGGARAAHQSGGGGARAAHQSGGGGSHPGLRAKALNWSGILAQRQGDYVLARARYRESLAIMGEVGDRTGMAAALLGLGNLWALQGDATARFFFDESLTIGRELHDKATMAASLTNLGWLAHNQGDFTAARSLDTESLELRRELGDRHGTAVVLGNLGFLAFQQGDHGRARLLDEESLALREELGDRHGIAMVLLNLGHVAFQEGDDTAAGELYQRSLSLRREIGDPHGEAGSLAALAELARAGGDADLAEEHLEEALVVARELGDQYRVAFLLVRLGRLARGRGSLDEAEALYMQALSAAGDLPPRTMVAEWLEGLAATAAALGRAERAARLLGAADAVRQVIGAPLPPREVHDRDQTTVVARNALGSGRYEAAWSEGRGLRLDGAVRLGRGMM